MYKIINGLSEESESFCWRRLNKDEIKIKLSFLLLKSGRWLEEAGASSQSAGQAAWRTFEQHSSGEHLRRDWPMETLAPRFVGSALFCVAK